MRQISFALPHIINELPHILVDTRHFKVGMPHIQEGALLVGPARARRRGGLTQNILDFPWRALAMRQISGGMTQNLGFPQE